MSDEPETTSEAKVEKVEPKPPPTAPWQCLGACGQTFAGPESIEAAREAGAPVACPSCASDHVIFAG